MFKWLHHLFNPHCELCLDDERSELIEYLKIENSHLKIENAKLINRLLNNKSENGISDIGSKDTIQHEIIKPRHVPWHVQKQMLEDKDREEALIISKKQEEDKLAKIEELEKKIIDAG